VLLLAGLAMPVAAQEVKLEWKFEKGKPFFQEMTTKTDQSMKVMGMDITQTQNQTFIFGWTPKDQDKDKNWVVDQKIEAVKMDIEIGGNKISYDSTKDTAGTGNALADFFKALVGSTFTLTISPDMKVLKVEGRDDFVNKLVKANPQMKPLLEQILGEDALKQMSETAFGMLPNKPVKKGDTWTKESKLNMGPIGTYITNYKYTYEGKDGKLDKIKVDSNLTYEAPGPAAAGTLPFKITEAKLASKNSSGTIWFDNDKHRIDHSEMKLTLDGTLKIDIGAMSTEVTLTQNQTTTVKTSDTNPTGPATPPTPPPAPPKKQ
jgi:hypothetical protein